MDTSNLQEVIKLLLPVIAFLVSYAIQQGHFSNQTNYVISASTILISAILTAFLQGKLTGNTVDDVLLISGIATTLQIETFAPLQQYLRQNFINMKKTIPQDDSKVQP